MWFDTDHAAESATSGGSGKVLDRRQDDAATRMATWDFVQI
jgi:hypothetical protein